MANPDLGHGITVRVSKSGSNYRAKLVNSKNKVVNEEVLSSPKALKLWVGSAGKHAVAVAKEQAEAHAAVKARGRYKDKFGVWRQG